MCQKILQQGVGGVYCTDTFNLERESIFTYHENDTVWFYYDNAFRPVYMFNTQVGDTHVLFDNSDLWSVDSTTSYVVQSTNIEIVNGDSLRSYTLKRVKDTTLASQEIHITERIGCYEFLFIPRDYSGWQDGPSWGVVCYNDSIINFHRLTNLTCDPCAHAVSIAEHITQNELLIYPNPVDDFLTLKVEGFSINKIDIKDITGKLLISKRDSHFSDENKIDVQDLNTGVYLITVRLSNNTVLTQKFVKK